MKKGQVTIFIVLGIVVLIIFGLMFFISKQTSNVNLETKINKIYKDFLTSTDIKRITQDCLDKTTKEALFLIGLQGGRIYDYQIEGGHHIESVYDVIPFNYTGRSEKGSIYNVGYGIKAPTNSNPPNYPYPGSLVGDISRLYKSKPNPYDDPNPYDKIFAEVSDPTKNSNILPDLCNKFGPNDPFIPGAGISCETYSVKNDSIQEYIKKYIEKNAEDCVNITVNTTGKDISLRNLSASVLIGEEDLLVSLKYPIEISIKGKPPITKYLDFNIRPKIRLKIIHEIASHLVGQDPFVHPLKYSVTDSNNIFFNIVKDDPNDCFGGSKKCIIDGINVSKLKDYCLNHFHCNFGNNHYDYSDIIVIRDDKSTIYGAPYRFLFAIENRMPALDFVDENVSSDEYYFWYINATYLDLITHEGRNVTEVYSKADGHPRSDFNIYISNSITLEIFPLGVDPDEDNLTYNYTVLSSPLLQWDTTTFQETEVTYYTGSYHPRKNVSGLVSDHAEQKDALVVIPWHTSDPGVVRIYVTDNEGLYDYQDVKILVDT